MIRQLISAALFTMGVSATSLAASTDTLVLTTYNIHSAIPNSRSNADYVPCCSDLSNVSDVLTTCGADIIALQEVRNMWTLPVKAKSACPMDMALYLAIKMDMNYAFGSTLDSESGYPENRTYTQWGAPDKWTNNGAQHGEYGNAVLSRFTIADNPQVIQLPRGNDERAEKLGDEPRNALRVELQDEVAGLGKVVIYSTHLQHNNGNTRKLQMEHLLNLGKAEASTATVFLMGDFNHYPHKGEPDLLRLAREAGFYDLAAEFAKKTGTKPASTMQETHRPERIDYIFCSKPVNVIDVSVLKSQVSDHLPVTVTVLTR